MANTYTQIYIQIVFAVKYRESLIKPEFREELHKFIIGIVTKRDQKLLAIYCMPDHCHILIRIRPTINLSKLVGEIKAVSSKFINDHHLKHRTFKWQEGFGAFSYSKDAVSNVINYILNQEEHHKKQSFKKEYFKFLKEFEVEYDEQYLFEWFES